MRAPHKKVDTARSSFSFDDYDNVIGFVVSQAGYQLAKALETTILEVGSDLRPREFAILNRLHQYGELTQTQLAELTYKDKPAMTRMLDRLIERKLVKKAMAVDDRRSFLVSLTPRGEAIRNAIVPRIVSVLETACTGISRKDLAITVVTLKKISAGL
ncbi:MAG TPA: MarR family winged helix-turn-helix transcriptional regulator [Alphaproteobacteria bacterium]|nr:MarR family winged helix-turn-helix transcriptional regulator [Alphaproteobacteria bacterium]